jgi:hypothetical protein
MATAARPALELSDVLHLHYPRYLHEHRPAFGVRRMFGAIAACRTARLGGHVQQCTRCNHKRISYNSCRNRHCPKCQVTNRERWILARQADLLPVVYYHVVFTLPQELNAYCLRQSGYFYDALFTCSRDTMLQFGYDPKHLGAQLGMVSVLHTWGQTLALHPHVHMIVPAGGVTQSGHWKSSRGKGQYLFPAKALAKVFRAKYMEQWKRWHLLNKVVPDKGIQRLLYEKNWVVYCKQPFAGPQAVIEYLGRYTHKIALSNHRLSKVDEQGVCFRYKDYKTGGANKQMHLSGVEFLRRFALHVLPYGFHRMRHYGFLANRNKHKISMLQSSMKAVRPKAAALSWQAFCKQQLGFDLDACPHCKTATLVAVQTFAARPSPMPKTKPLTPIDPTQF